MITSLPLLVGLKAALSCVDSFLGHCLIPFDSCCTSSMYIRAGQCVPEPHLVLRLPLANPSVSHSTLLCLAWPRSLIIPRVTN
jgi:LEA14-like dessication related protein